MTASYKIKWKSSAVKELRKLDSRAILQVLKSVEMLTSNPYPAGCRKLSASEYTYRIRIGSYRVIYSIYKKELVVEIVRVAHRKEAYR